MTHPSLVKDQHGLHRKPDFKEGKNMVLKAKAQQQWHFQKPLSEL